MSELIIPGGREPDVEINSGVNARLLVCKSCGTVSRLRDYQGDPNSDWELIEVINRHLGAAIDPRPESHVPQLYVIDEKALDAMDDETVKKSLQDDMDVKISSYRDEFKDDAMKCWKQHKNPTGGCPDWKTEGKVIGRKVGIPPSERAYACDYCVVSVWMENKANEKSGMFKGLK
jgi:hypothetical protein